MDESHFYFFMCFVVSYCLLYGKCLNTMNQWSHDFSVFATFCATLFFDAFWAPRDSLLAPLGLQVSHFWLPLAPFWFTFGIVWLRFGSLWLTFGTLFKEIIKTFIHSHIFMNLHAWLTIFTNSHVFRDTTAKKYVISQISSPALARSGTLP